MRRVVCLMLMLAMLNSCAHYVPVSGPIPHALRPEAGVERIRVWRHDSTSIDLRHPLLAGGQLEGITSGPNPHVIRIPLDSVSSVALRRSSDVGTGLVLLGAFGLVVVVLAGALAGFGSDIASGLCAGLGGSGCE